MKLYDYICPRKKLLKNLNMDAEKTVIETLKKAGKPLKAGEIAEMAGIEKKVVDKAIKALKTEEKIISPKRCYYEPK